MHKCHLLFCLLILLVSCSQPAEELVILSTSDTHSQVEPTDPLASKNANMGGYARRMGLITQERKQHPGLLLFDSGDFSQGTPYFNFYHGRVEVDALNRMGYDAATLGNHEFDNGLDTLAMLIRMANFPIVCANYDVAGTPLEDLVKPYVVLTRSGLRVGVFGLGVAPNDLISAKNFEPIRYLDPLPIINHTTEILRCDEHCDVVICLSHLGSDGVGAAGVEGDRDMTLIPQTHGLDVVLAAHTHHFYADERILDADGHEVVLTQMGKSGMSVGKLTLHLCKEGE